MPHSATGATSIDGAGPPLAAPAASAGSALAQCRADIEAANLELDSIRDKLRQVPDNAMLLADYRRVSSRIEEHQRLHTSLSITALAPQQ